MDGEPCLIGLQLAAGENAPAIMDWSSDGRFIIFARNNGTRDVWAGRLSSDGRWIAYLSVRQVGHDADAQLFSFPFPATQTGRPPITVLTNWTATIKK